MTDRNRQPITITINSDVLRQLDAARGDTPRSRAVEAAVLAWLPTAPLVAYVGPEIDRARTEGRNDCDVWEADAWLEAAPPTVAAETSDQALEALKAQLQAEAHLENVHLFGVDRYLAELRAEAREAVEDDLAERWEAAEAAGATVYRVLEQDGQEATEGEPENRAGARVIQTEGGAWLWVDDQDGYQWIEDDSIAEMRAHKHTAFLEAE